ncbi:hypothetical protein FJT64_023826 [Amphibalanus amphitrite]|uniref:Apple domain-containing protein n=1 Tax=Amphibalanus amphitrite TaxID=1232801 RepID=A0A6A4WQJ1_AMPAM|nr:hypothetical protein FJT64_023826 [Amphibalanus amphitrite]
MALLRALLAVTLCWHYPAALGEQPLPPRAFSFDQLPVGIGVLPAASARHPVDGSSECACRHRCLADPACRGYGYSVNTSSCWLTELLPTPERMQPSAEDWRWYARSGVRPLGEPCAVDQDCSTLVPGASCVNGTCGCHGQVTEDGAGGCRKLGGFIEVHNHQLTTGLLSETPGTTLDACSASCADELRCMAFDFSEGLCRTFSAGVTSDEVTKGRAAQRMFIWSFPRADGSPPDTYEPTPAGPLRLVRAAVATAASSVCYTDGAILFPGRQQDGRGLGARLPD